MDIIGEKRKLMDSGAVKLNGLAISGIEMRNQLFMIEMQFISFDAHLLVCSLSNVNIAC